MRATCSVVTALCLLARVAAAQADYPGELVSAPGSGVKEGTIGRLVLADTALYFTQRNGQPILVLPFSAVTDAYTTPSLGGGVGRTSTASDRYLVVLMSHEGRSESAIFSAPPPSADELAVGIIGGLDARRASLYATKPSPAAPQVVQPTHAPLPRPEPAPHEQIVSQPPAPTYSRPAAPPQAPPKVSPVREIQEGEPGYKDGGTAVLLSFLVAGGGQMYAGETGTGLFYLLGSVAAIGVGAGLSECGYYDCNYTPLYVGLGVALALDLASIFDAAPATHRHNRKLALKRAQQSFAPFIAPGAERTQLGMRVAIP